MYSEMGTMSNGGVCDYGVFPKSNENLEPPSSFGRVRTNFNTGSEIESDDIGGRHRR